MDAIRPDLPSPGPISRTLAQYEQATTTLRALENRGSEAATFLYVGQVYEDLGETAKAEEWYRKVLGRSTIGPGAGGMSMMR